MTNPFEQPQALTELAFTVPEQQAVCLEMGFEEMALASSRFIVDEDAGIWRLTVLYDAAAGVDIAAHMAGLREAYGMDFPEPEAKRVETQDWVAKVQESFRPIHAGRFYVHGSHIDDVPQVGIVPIRMDAGGAFGTGEHETTSGCLLALDALAKSRRFERVLDMGCGSGILAIAAAKLWNARVDAVDIDAVSVKVAAENMRLNEVDVRCWCNDGYRGLERRAAPHPNPLPRERGAALRAASGGYDLIIANILARPLMVMAKDLKRHLAPGGTVVLSGLLVRQETMVLWAHRQQGLTLKARYRRNGWSALVLK